MARTFIQSLTLDDGLVTALTADVILTSDLPGGGGSGTVTSVGLALPAIFSVSGSPVTTSGTLTGSLATQSANTVWAGPTTGAAAAPAFRGLVTADLPAGTGTVTSVALTVPAWLTVSGSPITTSGTLAVSAGTQAANLVLAGPSSGAAATPGFRALVAADLPAGAMSPLTTKGDLYTYSSADARLAVGANGQVLIADSTTAAGLAWNTPIEKTTQSANLVFVSPDGSSGAPTFRTLVAADLPTVTAVKGGTGQTAYTNGDLLYASSSSALNKLGIGSAGQVLWVASGLPAWRTLKGGDVTAQGCQAYQSANQSISNATFTAVPLNTEIADTDAFHEGVTNPSRVTIPSGMGGWYAVTATCVWTSNATGNRWLRVVLNNSANLLEDSRAALNGDTTDLTVSGTLKLAAGDFLELFLKQTSGGALNALAGQPGSLTLAVFFLGK